MKAGTIFGVGLGPGAADLMTLRAERLLRKTSTIAYFRKKGRAGRARTTVEEVLRHDVREIAMEYPVTTEIPLSDPAYNEALSGFYNKEAARLRDIAEGGEDVVVLAEGDPFFYGSFMHLHARLKDHVPVEVVPGVTAMSAAWTAAGMPITWGDDRLAVLTGTSGKSDLADAMAQADALVVMKTGRHLDKVRDALVQSRKAAGAIVVEFAEMPQERVRPLDEVGGSELPYFSIILVPGTGRRP